MTSISEVKETTDNCAGPPVIVRRTSAGTFRRVTPTATPSTPAQIGELVTASTMATETAESTSEMEADLQPSDDRFVPLDPQDPKVNSEIRARYMKMFYDMYHKNASEDEALTLAQNEEKAIFDRSTGKVTYLSAVAGVLKRFQGQMTKSQQEVHTASLNDPLSSTVSAADMPRSPNDSGLGQHMKERKTPTTDRRKTTRKSVSSNETPSATKRKKSSARTRKSQAQEAETKPIWVIEKILDHRFNDEIHKEEWLVKWRDYGPEYNSWEPRESFLSDELLKDFEQEQKAKELDLGGSTQSSGRTEPISKVGTKPISTVPKETHLEAKIRSLETVSQMTEDLDKPQETFPKTSTANRRRSIRLQSIQKVNEAPIESTKSSLGPATKVIETEAASGSSTKRNSKAAKRTLYSSSLDSSSQQTEPHKKAKKSLVYHKSPPVMDEKLDETIDFLVNKLEKKDELVRFKLDLMALKEEKVSTEEKFDSVKGLASYLLQLSAKVNMVERELSQVLEAERILTEKVAQFQAAKSTWHGKVMESLEQDGLLEQLNLTHNSEIGELIEALNNESEKPSGNNIDFTNCLLKINMTEN